MSEQPIHVGFGVDVHEGDALEFQADILITKDWRGKSGGLDRILYARIKSAGIDTPKLKDNEYILAPGAGIAQADYVMLVGASYRQIRSYTDIRKLSQDMLLMAAQALPDAQHIATHLQGANRGFDEGEALRAMLLGFNDAYEAGDYPPGLKHITFVENTPFRAELMRLHLNDILPETTVVEGTRQAGQDIANILGGQASFAEAAQRPEAGDESPHIFVAMPFDDAYDDQYYLAIYPAVKSLNYLCVRLDQLESAFTGNIIEAIKDRIDKASLVIALLDSNNPNVYLEVGYAWGRDVPTVLIAHEGEIGQEGEDLPFDIRGERLLLYTHIYKLRDQLTKELDMLLK